MKNTRFPDITSSFFFFSFLFSFFECGWWFAVLQTLLSITGTSPRQIPVYILMSLANKYSCIQTTYGSHTDLFDKAQEYTQVKVKVISVYSYVSKLYPCIHSCSLFSSLCLWLSLKKKHTIFSLLYKACSEWQVIYFGGIAVLPIWLK